VLFSYSPCPRKAGYSAHSVHGLKPGSTALQVHILLRTAVAYPHGSTPGTQTGLRRNRVGSPMPLGDARSPQAQHTLLPPFSTHPKLGVSSKHQRFHSCAL